MTNRRINRTTDARVADALGWRSGVWHGAWHEDSVDAEPGQVVCRDGVGWRTPNGSLRRTLPPFAASEHYVPMLLRWLEGRADLVIRPHAKGVRVQAWWLDKDGEGDGFGIELDAISMPQAVAETVIAYQEHLDELGMLGCDECNDENEDEHHG